MAFSFVTLRVFAIQKKDWLRKKNEFLRWNRESGGWRAAMIKIGWSGYKWSMNWRIVHECFISGGYAGGCAGGLAGLIRETWLRQVILKRMMHSREIRFLPGVGGQYLGFQPAPGGDTLRPVCIRIQWAQASLWLILEKFSEALGGPFSRLDGWIDRWMVKCIPIFPSILRHFVSFRSAALLPFK